MVVSAGQYTTIFQNDEENLFDRYNTYKWRFMEPVCAWAFIFYASKGELEFRIRFLSTFRSVYSNFSNVPKSLYPSLYTKKDTGCE